MPEIQAGPVRLYYEAHGRGSPVLFIMGLGAQLVLWPDDLWQPLAQRGFQVLRFDNRDIGQSQWLSHLPVPNTALAASLHLMGRKPRPYYRLADMADDVAHLLAALNLPAAHIVGASMGGMIAQHLAVRHPDRVRSLCLIMSSPGSRGLPGPRHRVGARLLYRPSGRDPEALTRYSVRTMQVIGSPGFPEDPELLAHRARLGHARGYHPAGQKRQLLASLAEHPRDALCRQIQQPSLVIHGADDPLVPVAHGRRLAQLIPSAQLLEIPGMGHDLPTGLLPDLNAALRSHLEAVEGD